MRIIIRSAKVKRSIYAGAENRVTNPTVTDHTNPIRQIVIKKKNPAISNISLPAFYQ